MARKKKNPYAVALGRIGGLKGGPARAANMTPEERSASARSAVQARWATEGTPGHERRKDRVLVAPDDGSVEKEFTALKNAWKAGRSATSSTVVMAMHPAYQKIIGLGRPSVPLILRELQQETDHWFWALKAITREDPVPPRSRGRMREMADAWLTWGRKLGYVR